MRNGTVGERQIIHILHIGKTGGTAIREAISLNPLSSQYMLVHRKHKVHLKHIPKGEKVIFFLRDPLSRFVSSFYSRKRKGMPRYSNQWTPKEALAFSQFSTANELGLALSSPDIEHRKTAEEAMKSIGHVKNFFWDWFGDKEYFNKRKDDIFFIGYQENLNKDFQKLKLLCGLDPKITLPTDPFKAHKFLGNDDKNLDKKAEDALKQWYAKDYAFMAYVKNHFNQQC